MRPAHLLLMFSSLVLLAACGGGGGGGGGGAGEAIGTLNVSATNGNDTTGDGSSERPFRTITAALRVATSGVTVQVAPGTYNAALGEVFPLEPASGVTVRGFRSFATPGSPKHLTFVVGGGLWGGDFDGRLHGTFVPAPGSTLFGLSVQNPEPFGPLTGPKPAPIILATQGVTIESCLLHDSDKGIRMVQGAFKSILKRCEFSGNTVGIFVDGAGPGCRVEDCTVTGNSTGVIAFTGGVDFGGGSAGSLGGNAFIKSGASDFVYLVNSGTTASARDCCWDNAVPTLSVGNPPSNPNADVWQNGGTVDTTGATKCSASTGGPIGTTPPSGAVE